MFVPGIGRHGFDPGPRHTKVIKNGTSCSSLGTQTYWVELGLVEPLVSPHEKYADSHVPYPEVVLNQGSTVGFLLLQCFSGLLNTSGISRCRSQDVSVESSSLFHHSFYL